jgi:hypothetical protein
MAIDKIQIVSSALNNIKLDELVQVDRANGSSDVETLRDKGETSEKSTGLYVPFIVVNGYNITKYLTKFYLDLSGFLPTVRFSFIAAESVFISVNYPKDGDIVSVYLRAPGDFYKPFRMDFNVLSVASEPTSRYAEGGVDHKAKGINLRFTITGECRIPGLYTQRIKSFSNLSSNDCLLEVSQDLNLGFASNEKTTDDKMTWICPSYSYYDFIQEVAIRAYKDDHSSFFDCWIDSYYTLNFVNLGNQFSYTKSPDQKAVFLPGNSQAGLSVSNAIPGTPDTDPVEMSLLITNLTGYGTVPYFPIGYTLTSRAGNNTNRMGYVNEIGFYDETSDKKDPSQKYVKYDVETQTPESVSTGMILQKGRARENNYKDEKRIEWHGVLNTRTSDTSGGVHENFLHAKVQNLINVNDVTKMTLEVELMNYFPGIYRGQVLPVQLYAFDNDVRAQNVGAQGNKQTNTSGQPTLDVFLSGNYVVMGMSVYWSYGGVMRQSLTLAKREWTANSSGSLPKAFPVSLTKGIF